MLCPSFDAYRVSTANSTSASVNLEINDLLCFHNGIHPASSNPSNQLFAIFRDVKIQSAKATPLQAVSDKGLNT